MKNFKISICLFQNGQKKIIEKKIGATSVALAWRTAFALIPSEKKLGEVKIKILPC